MLNYYKERFYWIFSFTSRNFFYCLAKSLCILVGLPIYLVAFTVEMILTFVNMIFGWIPVLNVVVTVICKSLIYVFDKTFYICILTDIKKYRLAMKQEPEYSITDVSDTGEENNTESAVSDGKDEETLPDTDKDI